MQILPDTLQTFEYYRKLIPTYLKSVDGFSELLKLWYDFSMSPSKYLTCGNKLCGIKMSSSFSVINAIEAIFRYLDIFNISSEHEGENSDILTKLGSFLGLSRNFSLVIDDETKQISLTDDEYLILIKCQLVKNFFQGNSKHLRECFDLINLPIISLSSQSESASAILYLLLYSEDDVSQNIKDMFLAGMINIESMGIKYRYVIQLLENIAIFDSVSQTAVFDAGEFII